MCKNNLNLMIIKHNNQKKINLKIIPLQTFNLEHMKDKYLMD